MGFMIGTILKLFIVFSVVIALGMYLVIVGGNNYHDYEIKQKPMRKED